MEMMMIRTKMRPMMMSVMIWTIHQRTWTLIKKHDRMNEFKTPEEKQRTYQGCAERPVAYWQNTHG
jgi:hypothetical protein